MKTFILLTLTTFLSLSSIETKAQGALIEDVIADTACNCLKTINTDTLSPTKINAAYNKCLSDAIVKNQTAIIESYNSGEQGKKMDENNPNNTRLMIRVQAVVARKCSDYQRVNSKIRNASQQR